MEILRTKRLTIRPFSMDDLETAHQVLDQEMQWNGADVSLLQQKQALHREIVLADWHDGSRLFGA